MPRLIILCALVTICVLIVCFPDQFETGVVALLEWINGNKEIGVITLGFIIALATSIAIPGTLMTIGTGYIMDAVYEGEHWKSIMVGVLTVFLGTWLGSLVSFFIGRYVFRELTLQIARRYRVMRALDCAFLEKGFQTCVLFRVCPMVPFNAFNFLAGATSLQFRSYFFAFIGYLPICILNVWIGTTIKSISEVISGDYEGGETSIIVLIIGLIISIIIVVYISCLVHRYLRKFISDKQIAPK